MLGVVKNQCAYSTPSYSSQTAIDKQLNQAEGG
jgi:hypothetical protein